MKITSFNTLYYGYSYGQTSIHDQTGVVRWYLEQEKPDVAVLFEMPNPHQPVTGENLVVSEQLWTLISHIRERGYGYQRYTDDRLSTWIVSKYPLTPLVLLGSSTVSGAIANLFSGVPTTANGRINPNSSYVDCLRVACEPDRSLVVGVQYKRSVLPVIALHAKCLFFNPRFGRLLFFLLRAFVAQRGVIVTDLNFDPSGPSAELLEDREFASTLPVLAGRLEGIPLGQRVGNARGVNSSCCSIVYPYCPLNIDMAIAPADVDVTSRIGNTTGDPIPNPKFASDHRYLSVDQVPDGCFLEGVTGAREGSYAWSQTHPELVGIYNDRIPFPTVESPVNPAPRMLALAPTDTPTVTPVGGPVTVQSLLQAREYLQQHFPGAQICHHTLRGTARLTASNGFGPSCHPKCTGLHCLEGHPMLQSLVNGDNILDGGVYWRGVCAWPECTGIHGP